MFGIAAVIPPYMEEQIYVFTCAGTQEVNIFRYGMDGKGAQDDVRVEKNEDPDQPCKKEDPGKGSEKKEDSDKACQKMGAIRIPSALAGLTINKQLYVFGIRRDDTICVVSPEVCALESFPKVVPKGAALACCGTGDSAWLYYIGQRDAGSRLIKEYSVTEAIEDTYQKATPTEGSALAAFFKPDKDGSGGTRWIIYQDAEGLQSVNSNKGVIPVVRKTPLAAAYVAGRGYVFYADRENTLTVVAFENGVWEEPEVVPKAREMHDGSGVSAVVRPDSEAILIAYYRVESQPRLCVVTYSPK